MKANKPILFILSMLGLFWSCSNYTPKPKAYPRVDYPVKEYHKIETDCPFSFDIPIYSKLENYQYGDQPCWYNLNYPQFNATLHLSYIPFSNIQELDSLGEDAYQLAHKHIRVAEEIVEREITDTTKSIFGMIYDLEGKTATPLNFYLTDGKQHFFRGSFYFNAKTSRDSVLPIYNFIHEDIIRTITSFNFE
jgi:gliding motility-associated lipoprotein GldD